jgi:tRNA threonylcarbamoyladenosine biosynthesis protein TsaB
MNILAIDTASALLSVAVSSPRGVRCSESESPLTHSERLMEVIDTLVTEAGLEREDLELAACMEGPGSFTGLRIGFAAAKGIALALGIPLLPVPTLDCIAFPHAAWPGSVIVAIDARKKRFFSALYRGGRRLTEQLDAAPEEIAGLLVALRPIGEPALITGPDAPLLFQALGGIPAGTPDGGHAPAESLVLDSGYRRGYSRELLEISRKMIILSDKSIFASDSAGPVYLRKSDAELNLG